jgi:hypothetical protein
MTGRDGPKNGGREDRLPDRLPFGWIERLILDVIVPADLRATFKGDLLEEGDTHARGEKGDKSARDWIRRQALHAVIPMLVLRYRRAKRAVLAAATPAPAGPRRGRRFGVRMRTASGIVFAFLLVAYLLPGFLVGLSLYGLGIVIWSLVDALMRSDLADRRPPRGFARFILNVVVPRRSRDGFIDDLREEYEATILEQGPRAARAWLRAQVRRSVWTGLVWRVARLVDFILSDEFSAWAIKVAICVYLAPAAIAVLFLIVVGIVLGAFVDTLRRPPWKSLARGARAIIHWVVDAFRRFLHRLLVSLGGTLGRARTDEARPGGDRGPMGLPEFVACS